ncbi:MAG: tRNA (N6-threonylcarbamoyladenosine(37)-N6)-methyltransferase TrmO [Candidatus Hodarchaeota archaeon]
MNLCASTVGFIRKRDDGLIFIEIEPQYWEATLQVDQFSHIIVLWWITGHDNPTSRANLQDYPPQEAAKLSGVFASRSPARPTPIGLSIVAIQRIDEETHRIYIDQIDAHDATPVVDIKPYMPFSDKVDVAKVPIWFRDNVSRYTSHPFQ